MTNQALINIANVNNKILEIQRAADTGGSPPEYRGEGIVLLKNFAQGSTNSGKPKYTGTIVSPPAVIGHQTATHGKTDR